MKQGDYTMYNEDKKKQRARAKFETIKHVKLNFKLERGYAKIIERTESTINEKV